MHNLDRQSPETHDGAERVSRLRPNDAEVAAQVIDGEAIMIHLVSGTYYSMDGVGGIVWNLLCAGHDLDSIAETLAGRFLVSRAHARADLAELANALLAEGLVAVSAGPAATRVVVGEDAERLPYTRPQLNVYRDMADLLALDPPKPRPPMAPWKDD